MKHLFQNFDSAFFKRMMSPKASGDLNAFMEKLPQNTNKTMLVITGVAWALAGLSGLYASIQLGQFTEMRATLQEMEAVKPSVPTLENKPVSDQNLENFVKGAKKVYTGLAIDAKNGEITISGASIANFGQFREAIGHVQNGGDGWRVTIEQLCVGRECGKKPLEALLKINKIEVKEPAKDAS